MITIEDTLYVDARGHATFVLPPTISLGEHRVVMHVDEAPFTPELRNLKVTPKAGSLKGIKMSADFDAPLEEFREYME